jgi:ribose-phosphate pyrophosphokinase
MIYTIKYPEDAGTKFEMFRYPGGEVQVRFSEEQSAQFGQADEVLIFATIRDGELMGLAQLNSALDGLGHYPILFLPYLPYGRADRRFTGGDCAGLRTFAEQINTMNFKKVVTLDAHSEAAWREFDGLIDVSPRLIINTVLERLWRPRMETIIMSGVGILLPDAGASRYGLRTNLVASKVRDPQTGKLTEFKVPEKHGFASLSSILIVDDICDGGGTFIGLAEQLKDYGLELNLYVTHGIFSKGLTELFRYYTHIFTTDSLPQNLTWGRSEGRFIVIPARGLMLDAVLSRSDLYRNAEGGTN